MPLSSNISRMTKYLNSETSCLQTDLFVWYNNVMQQKNISKSSSNIVNDMIIQGFQMWDSAVRFIRTNDVVRSNREASWNLNSSLGSLDIYTMETLPKSYLSLSHLLSNISFLMCNTITGGFSECSNAFKSACLEILVIWLDI